MNSPIIENIKLLQKHVAAASLSVLLLCLLPSCKLPQYSQSLDAVMQEEIQRSSSTVPSFRCTHGAHRGDSVSYLENTTPALQAAEKDERYAFIEFDVQYSQDDQIIIFHDSRLRRLFDSAGSISKLSYQEIQQYSGNQIPLYYDIIGDLDKRLNIEIKSQGDDAQDARLADELIADLKQRGKLKQVMISSISDEVIYYIKTNYPKVPTGQIFWITSSTFLHFDSLTQRLYKKISHSEADYIMLHVENFRNIEKLIKLKPKHTTIMFWNFSDSMYMLHASHNDRIWGRSAIGHWWDSLRYKVAALRS
jgi:glycerophosphoryl diester phosphodiesterase